MKYILLISALIFISFFNTTLSINSGAKSACREHFQKGKTFFELRSKGANDWQAKSNYIDSAIYHFQRSINCSDFRQQSAYYFLRSLHFKSMYTGLPDQERKRIYNEAKINGEKLSDEFPNDAGIKLWYLASAGKWIQHYGIFRAAYEGLGPKIKETCERIIEIDPRYENGIGYRMLGLVYYKAPYIPVVLTWPDEEKGISLTHKALEIEPKNIGNLFFMGKIYYMDEQYEKALLYLNMCREQKARKDYLIMERFDQMKARHYIDIIESKGFGQ